MNRRGLVLVLSALVVILVVVVPALGSEEQDDFVIIGADAVATRAVDAFTSPVPLDPRFITEYVKTMNVREIEPVPEEMPRDLDPRFILQYGKSMAVREIEPVPPEMPRDLGPRFILQYVKTFRHISMAYPCELVGEPDDPVISDLQVTDLQTDQATISWFTDEYTDGLLEYGLSPGTYSWTAYEEEWGNAHSFTLTGLSGYGTIYYYRVSSTDRCANTATSEELSFRTLGFNVYLPLILREH